MSTKPERWVVVDITVDGESTKKVFAGWYGGYLDGDSWKLNSGIASEQELDKILARVHAPLDFALTLEADVDVLLGRLTGRRVCRKCGAIFNVTYKPSKKEGICDMCGGELYQRSDDNAATIESRMKVYQQSTAPIIDYYAKQNRLKKIDANVEAAEVRLALAALLK